MVLWLTLVVTNQSPRVWSAHRPGPGLVVEKSERLLLGLVHGVWGGDWRGLCSRHVIRRALDPHRFLSS